LDALSYLETMIAIVTGANKGIGQEVARQLAESGHTVYLGSRSLERGQKACAALGNPENLKVIELDVSHPESVAEAARRIESEEGRLDILVNNAGINYDTWQSASDADLENVRETIETNLFGAWSMIQAFLPLMQKNGFGRIVNVSSGSGAITGMGGGTPGYSISKTALNVLTIKIAAEIHSQDILVNSGCPGWVRTDMGGSSASRSVAEGADTIVWAAQLPKGGPSGKFFRDRSEIDF
jgi:NAD(P)-dependent dehydrogenase (short-subunit alcohol dehydrogenase family)